MIAVRSALALLLLLLALALGGCFYALDGSLVKKARDGGADGADAGVDSGRTDSSLADGPAASDQG